MKTIDRNLKIPLYCQVKEIVKEKIINKEHLFNDVLPTEPDLCKQFSVSRITIRNAMAELVNEGLLYRQQGKGTFIRSTSENFSKQKTRNIALVIFDIRYATHPAMVEIIRGMGEITGVNGYNLQIYATKHAPADHLRESLKCLDIIPKSHVDGLIIACQEISNEEITNLQRVSIPFVAINHDLRGENAHTVIVDYLYGAFIATEHLTRLGHKIVALINGYMSIDIGEEFSKGYKLAIDKYGLDCREVLLREGHYSEEDAFVETESLLNLPERPTAIVAGDDTMACGVLRKAKEKGLRVPEDLAVVGCNNTCITNPALTTLDGLGGVVGKTATEILIGIIENKKIEQTKVVIKPKLIVRESCGGLKQWQSLSS